MPEYRAHGCALYLIKMLWEDQSSFREFLYV